MSSSYQKAYKITPSHLRTDDDNRYVLRNDYEHVWVYDQICKKTILSFDTADLTDIEWMWRYLDILNKEDNQYRIIICDYVEEDATGNLALFTTPFKTVFVDWSKVKFK